MVLQNMKIMKQILKSKFSYMKSQDYCSVHSTCSQHHKNNFTRNIIKLLEKNKISLKFFEANKKTRKRVENFILRAKNIFPIQVIESFLVHKFLLCSNSLFNIIKIFFAGKLRKFIIHKKDSKSCWEEKTL